jgi:hypothetical protein
MTSLSLIKSILGYGFFSVINCYNNYNNENYYLLVLDFTLIILTFLLINIKKYLLLSIYYYYIFAIIFIIHFIVLEIQFNFKYTLLYTIPYYYYIVKSQLSIYNNYKNFYSNFIIENNNTKNCDECSICYEEMNNDIVFTKCKHKFHKKCISEWICYKNTCPKCRFEFN